MTKLTNEVSRETNVKVQSGRKQDRVLIVTLEHNEEGDRILMRPKGCKLEHAVSIADVWRLAIAPVKLCAECHGKLESLIK